jgi:hypothetical protein
VKVAIARRLRQETTMPLKWIALRTPRALLSAKEIKSMSKRKSEEWNPSISTV